MTNLTARLFMPRFSLSESVALTVSCVSVSHGDLLVTSLFFAGFIVLSAIGATLTNPKEQGHK